MNREIPYSYYFSIRGTESTDYFFRHHGSTNKCRYRYIIGFSSVIRKFLGFCLYSKVIIRQKNILKFKAPQLGTISLVFPKCSINQSSW